MEKNPNSLNSNEIPGLEPLKINNMADQVEAKLRKYIQAEKFKPGDILPKEIEIANALGVSRNIVREALSRFKMLGIIKSKKRRGMILATPDLLSGFERVLDPVLLSQGSLKDLFELRLLLEIGMADLLYLRKKEADILELEAIVSKEESNSSPTFKLAREVEFHGKLYQITGNSTLLRFQKMLLPIFQFVLQKEKEKGNEVRVGPKNHKDLVDVLKSGTPTAFQETIRAHFEPHFDLLTDLNS